ncbi:hypothetical protein NEF87_000968 [Candidatus Lokiarchaeum ossiferum]|uniref:HEAT repeat domain-containing protein n=1 Tax=Candidatus Lokiarchaeum ossiferum TaxID=2951803 RepID=A0ABY6HMF1_9ARCH|nr:hypothetical protein NEF87_000968 [Candidatus Lokiarchaeum sp. B-35]
MTAKSNPVKNSRISFSQKKLDEELQKTYHLQMKWIQEESNIQLNHIIDQFTQKSAKRIENLSINLLPYFKEQLNSDNAQIRELAARGLEEIKKNSPHLV